MEDPRKQKKWNKLTNWLKIPEDLTWPKKLFQVFAHIFLWLSNIFLAWGIFIGIANFLSRPYPFRSNPILSAIASFPTFSPYLLIIFFLITIIILLWNRRNEVPADTDKGIKYWGKFFRFPIVILLIFVVLVLLNNLPFHTDYTVGDIVNEQREVPSGYDGYAWLNLDKNIFTYSSFQNGYLSDPTVVDSDHFPNNLKNGDSVNLQLTTNEIEFLKEKGLKLIGDNNYVLQIRNLSSFSEKVNNDPTFEKSLENIYKNFFMIKTNDTVKTESLLENAYINQTWSKALERMTLKISYIEKESNGKYQIDTAYPIFFDNNFNLDSEPAQYFPGYKFTIYKYTNNLNSFIPNPEVVAIKSEFDTIAEAKKEAQSLGQPLIP